VSEIARLIERREGPYVTLKVPLLPGRRGEPDLVILASQAARP